MKKVIIIVFALVLLMGNLAWCDLQEQYKKGPLALNAVDGFGKGNDWGELFHRPYKNMIVADDGSIFISNSREHNIFKFSKDGKLVKTFGHKGQGPSDFKSPTGLSILDKKYLVVAEYASNRRFTLWDLNGNFIKVVRTQSSIFHLTALRDNRVAYYHTTQHAQNQNDFQTIIAIKIKDISSGKEKTLKKIKLLDRSWIKLERGIIQYGNFFGQLYLAQTSAGNLAVGVSNQTKIDVFSPTGELIRSFDLKVRPIATANGYVSEFRDNHMKELNSRDEKKMSQSKRFWHTMEKKRLKNFNFSTIFDTYLPLYKEILVDRDGNFLVIKFSECQKQCNPVFQVYSKEGVFICETKLDTGSFELDIDRRFRKLRFTHTGILAIVSDKGDEEENLKLIKSNY